MRRRLTIAILCLVAATLVVSTIGSYVLTRRAAITTTQQGLAKQARAISDTFSADTRTRAIFQKELRVISSSGAFSGIAFLVLHPDGTVQGTLPAGITAATIDVPALAAGKQVTGHTRSLLAYSAVPTPIARVVTYTPVLVVTRQVHDPANGLRYFGLVSVIALLIAALVAAALARRFTRPLVAAGTATQRIASGDLDATVEVGRREDPEFARLAESINSMGANLVRARDQERQFILSVSHELRTPLTSIRGYADAVVDGAAEDPQAAAVVIGAEARRLERLVQDLLDLARLDADRFSLDLRAVDGAAVVSQVADGFRPRATELGLELVTAPGSEDPLWVNADTDRLGQVMANLVENASSFADHRIVVGAGTTGGLATLWVVDDGPGIPSDQLARVFERHFTSDRAGGRRQGSGLGLAIVSELAAAMGASVRADSPVAEGRGTRMSLWFRPVADPHQAPPPPSSPAPPPPPAPALAVGGAPTAGGGPPGTTTPGDTDTTGGNP